MHMNEKILKMIKLFIFVVSIVIGLIGVGLIVWAMIGIKINDYIPNDDAVKYTQYYKYALCGIGGWFIIIGVNGFFSAWKTNRWIIAIF